MEGFFGGRPIMVVLKLAIVSVVVGIVLAALNLDARELLMGLQRLAERIYAMGFDAFTWVGEYFLLGAVIVFPIWLISRLFAAGKKRDE